MFQQTSLTSTHLFPPLFLLSCWWNLETFFFLLFFLQHFTAVQAVCQDEKKLQNHKVSPCHVFTDGKWGVCMAVCAEKLHMQFYRMRKQHRYVLHLFRVSWNLYCGNVWNLRALSQTCFSSTHRMWKSSLKNFVDYLHSLLFFSFVHTSISTVIKNSLKFNFSLGNNFHIICIFTAPWKIFRLFIPCAKTVFAIAGNSANFFLSFNLNILKEKKFSVPKNCHGTNKLNLLFKYLQFSLSFLSHDGESFWQFVEPFQWDVEQFD